MAEQIIHEALTLAASGASVPAARLAIFSAEARQRAAHGTITPMVLTRMQFNTQHGGKRRIADTLMVEMYG